MFDQLVSVAVTAPRGEAVAAWARVESAACARRLTAMVAMLDARQCADDSVTREQWYLDNWGAVCAEIGATQQITSGAASNQLLVATSLRDRLPKVAAVFAAGALTYQLASTIVWRTAAIKDPDALRAVDAEIAAAVADWEPMSQAKTITAIDVFVARHDPHALRRSQNRARGRCVNIDIDDASGAATLWGELFATDAKALDQRLDALAEAVCDADPRTADQRRADALGALAHGADRLACRCANPDCQATTPAAGSAVLYVITHDDTLTDQSEAAARQDAALDGVAPPMFDKPLRRAHPGRGADRPRSRRAHRHRAGGHAGRSGAGRPDHPPPGPGRGDQTDHPSRRRVHPNRATPRHGRWPTSSAAAISHAASPAARCPPNAATSTTPSRTRWGRRVPRT